MKSKRSGRIPALVGLGPAALVLLLAGCSGEDLVDIAAEQARGYAWQGAAAIDYDLEHHASRTIDERFVAVRELLASADGFDAAPELTGAEQDGDIGTYWVYFDVYEGKGGGWFSEHVTVRMCVRYVVDLNGADHVRPEGTRCEGEAAEVPEGDVEVHF